MPSSVAFCPAFSPVLPTRPMTRIPLRRKPSICAGPIKPVPATPTPIVCFVSCFVMNYLFFSETLNTFSSDLFLISGIGFLKNNFNLNTAIMQYVTHNSTILEKQQNQSDRIIFYSSLESVSLPELLWRLE